MDAGRIPVLQHETELQIASACVYNHMKLETLIQSVETRLRALEMINLIGVDAGQRNDILKKLNEQMTYLTSLRNTMLRFRASLEEFIERKAASLP